MPHHNGTHRTPSTGRADRTSIPCSPLQRPTRIALYSHDTMGLGHLRRNLLIAESLARGPLDVTSLMITGAHEAKLFAMPDRVDCLTLPRWHKSSDGTYQSGALDIHFQELVNLRSTTIRSAVHAFQPDVLIVDKIPLGAFGEVHSLLLDFKDDPARRCILGLRDVLDHPDDVARDWLHSEHIQAIEELYDEVWVYGDPTVFDPIREYCFPASIAAKVRYTGYLDQRARLDENLPTRAELLERLGLEDGPLAVCAVGGGQDGADLAAAFVAAVRNSPYRGVVLTGPFMPSPSRQAIQERAANLPNVSVCHFRPDADTLIARADAVVTMGGYNTVCAVMSFRKRALVVPRVRPRREQLVRAERLRDRGIVDLMLPSNVTSSGLRRWLQDAPPTPQRLPLGVDMEGLNRLADFIAAYHDSLPSDASLPL